MIFVSNPCDSLILGYLTPAVGLPLIPLMILAYPVLGRHFDPMIQHRESIDFYMGLLGTFLMRPGGYAVFIVMNVDWKKLEERAIRRNPNVNPLGPTIRTYGSIDFRSEANAFQIGFSWLYILLVALTVVLGFIYTFCKHFL